MKEFYFEYLDRQYLSRKVKMTQISASTLERARRRFFKNLAEHKGVFPKDTIILYIYDESMRKLWPETPWEITVSSVKILSYAGFSFASGDKYERPEACNFSATANLVVKTDEAVDTMVRIDRITRDRDRPIDIITVKSALFDYSFKNRRNIQLTPIEEAGYRAILPQVWKLVDEKYESDKAAHPELYCNSIFDTYPNYPDMTIKRGKD